MTKKILLAAPRGYCAGVDRAVEIVEKTLELYGPPVYVRKQIVHNIHVVRDFEKQGVIFVEDESDIPTGSVCVFSAHGVSPAVQENARRRRLNVIDATCPLVTKVHVEARRYADEDKTIVLIGHRDHEEIEGTSGEAPDSTVVVETVEEAMAVEVADPEKVAYLSQTTLSVDDTSRVIDALRERFPGIGSPKKDDICYATQNRQAAVKTLAREAEVVLVVGSRNSSNSTRLREVAETAGARAAYLIDDESEIMPSWLEGVEVVGVTSGASAPETLVEAVVKRLQGLDFSAIEERRVVEEEVHFPMPVELRRDLDAVQSAL